MYSLGLEVISESRIRDARKLMIRIIEELRERALRAGTATTTTTTTTSGAHTLGTRLRRRFRAARVIRQSFLFGSFTLCRVSRWTIILDGCCFLTDDTVSRLSLILESIKLEKFFWRGAHVPVVHECGHVLTEIRMARPLSSRAFGSYGRSRAHEDEDGEKFPSPVITRHVQSQRILFALLRLLERSR